MMNLNSNVRNTENSELHRYCQKEMESLLHQFTFEYVTLKHKQVGDYNSNRALYEFCLSIVNPGIYLCAVDAFLKIYAFFSTIFIKSTY